MYPRSRYDSEMVDSMENMFGVIVRLCLQRSFPECRRSRWIRSLKHPTSQTAWVRLCLVYSQNYTIMTVYNAVPLPPLQNQWMQKESRPTHPIR